MITKELFEKYYLEERMSMKEIATMFGKHEGWARWWKGKFNIPTNPFYRSPYGKIHGEPINPDAKYLILGSLLGDGSIVKVNSGAIFQAGHSTKYLDFLLWKKECLNDLCHAKLVYYTNYAFEKRVDAARVYTISHPELLTLRNSWYPNGNKIITADNISDINDLSLSVFYMDDGSLSKRGRNVEISTNNFSEVENEVISDVIYNKFNIMSRVAKKYSKRMDKHYNYLFIDKRNTDNLISVVRKYVSLVPSMLYKLPINS